jgi:hypothetical protein
LVKLGAEIETALLCRGDNEAKGNRLGRIAVQVARRLGVSMDDEPSPQRRLVEALFEWAHHRRELEVWDARTAGLEVIGCICAAAELSIAASMACGTPYEAALTQLEADSDQLAAMTFILTQGQKLPVSITDVRDTIRFGMTAHGRLRDWLLPAAIEKQRSAFGAKFAKFLGVADLRGMSVSEAAFRIRERAFQQLGA